MITNYLQIWRIRMYYARWEIIRVSIGASQLDDNARDIKCEFWAYMRLPVVEEEVMMYLSVYSSALSGAFHFSVNYIYSVGKSLQQNLISTKMYLLFRFAQ